MGIMKENSNSGIQRHLFSQTELNKEFALSKTTYKWVLCSLSMQPQMDYDQNICHKSLDRMYLLIIFGRPAYSSDVPEWGPGFSGGCVFNA
jgi:hypothetical protein